MLDPNDEKPCSVLGNAIVGAIDNLPLHIIELFAPTLYFHQLHDDHLKELGVLLQQCRNILKDKRPWFLYLDVRNAIHNKLPACFVCISKTKTGCTEGLTREAGSIQM